MYFQRLLVALSCIALGKAGIVGVDPKSLDVGDMPGLTIDKPEQCEMKLKFNGEPIEEDAAYADSGEYVFIQCDASCVGTGLPPALKWMKYNEKGKKIVIPRQRRRIHTSFSRFHRVLTLYMKPVRNLDFRLYSCRGYIDDTQKWVVKNFTLHSGCPSDRRMWCDTYKCISLTKRCDGVTDCNDGLDEIGCGCKADETQCEDGRCVAMGQTCDRVEECKECALPCGDGNTTYSYKNWCDGVWDCPNGRDEVCNCKSTETRCDDGRCQATDLFCDGKQDCLDGSDEYNCTGCIEDQFTCLSNGACIDASQRCDGSNDCGDNSDEGECGCSEDQFTCLSKGACIDASQRCDGSNDCDDNSDEGECCSEYQFTCLSNGACIDASQRCDGSDDCGDNSDEGECGCTEDQFTCHSNGACIDKVLLCDDINDCDDNSDEDNCATSTRRRQITTPTTTFTVPTTEASSSESSGPETTDTPATSTRRRQITTPTTTLTVPTTEASSSESSGPETTDTPEVNVDVGCPGDQFSCKSDGRCVLRSSVCNNFPDCDDGSDEGQECGASERACSEGQSLCPDNSACYSRSMACDGNNNCDDGWDEEGCESTDVEIIDDLPTTSSLLTSNVVGVDTDDDYYYYIY